MPLPDGKLIQPTGKRFAIGMATIGHGRMADGREWLFWDNQDFMTNSVWAASRQRGEQQAMREALIVNRPADTSSAPQGLLLLFHGVGSNAEDLAPLGGVATLNLFADLGHGIDSRVGRRLAEHLGTPTP